MKGSFESVRYEWRITTENGRQIQHQRLEKDVPKQGEKLHERKVVSAELIGIPRQRGRHTVQAVEIVVSEF